MEKTSGTKCRAQGGSDPTNFFGRLKAEKVGSLPPDFGALSTVTFALARFRSIGVQSNCLRHKVKVLEKYSVKGATFTLFTQSDRHFDVKQTFVKPIPCQIAPGLCDRSP